MKTITHRSRQALKMNKSFLILFLSMFLVVLSGTFVYANLNYSTGEDIYGVYSQENPEGILDYFSGTPSSLNYNSSAYLYYFNRSFDYAGSFPWITECSSDSYKDLNSSGELNVRIPIYNHSGIGLLTQGEYANYLEGVNLSVNIPEEEIMDKTYIGSEDYQLDSVWVELTKPDGSEKNVSLSGREIENSSLWYKFDNEGLFVNDSSGNNHTGNLSSVLFVDEGKIEGAYNFSGTSESYIVSEHNESFNFVEGEFTLMLWKKGYKQDSKLISKRDGNIGYEFSEKEGVLSFFLGGPSGFESVKLGNSLVNDSEWNHVALSFNSSGEAKVYVNGAFDGEASYSSQINFNNSGDFFIGKGFEGLIDDVKIYPRVLTEDEINSRYKLGFKDFSGGFFNTNFMDTSILGTHIIEYYANLTGGYSIVEILQSNFSVQNLSITIDVPERVNTTDTVSIKGKIGRTNGTDYWEISDNLFNIELNDVLVSSDSYSHNSFSEGGGTNLELGEEIYLEFGSVSGLVNYSDDFSTDDFETEAYNFSNVGWYSLGEYIFEGENMLEPIGEIVYRYNSQTKFYNASVFAKTLPSEGGTYGAGNNEGGGNSSLWYSFDNLNWYFLDSSVNPNETISGVIPVDGKEEFFVKIVSNTLDWSGENPISDYELIYSEHLYVDEGVYVSPSFYFPNVTYTVFNWDEELNGQEIKIQLRESSDNESWSDWSENYTSNLDNRLSNYSEEYLQYRAWLLTEDLYKTPVLNSVEFFYFGAITDESGDYNYNITIPTDNLGILPLTLKVPETPTGIVGENDSIMEVWARTELSSDLLSNFSGMANHSFSVNFSRRDTGDLVKGTMVFSISNEERSWGKSCSGSEICNFNWKVPDEIPYGNYTIEITGQNDSAYYGISSLEFNSYLEESNTTADLIVQDISIPDFRPGEDYVFYLNATLNNTGGGSMNDIFVWKASSSSAIKNVTQIEPSSDLLPGEEGNALIEVVIDGNYGAGEYYIVWRANWTNNDGSVGEDDSHIQTSNLVEVELDSTLELVEYSKTISVEHDSSDSFDFRVMSTGTADVVNVELGFVEEDRGEEGVINSSWVNINPNYFDSINWGTEENSTFSVDIPKHTPAGNYTGYIEINSSADPLRLNLTINIPEDGNWSIEPSENFTYNRTFGLNEEGEIAEFKIINLGNIDLNFSIDYSPSEEIDYSLLPGVFVENQIEGNETYNPTTVFSEKGENVTFKVYQNSWSEPLENIGIDIFLSDSDASPQDLNLKDSWNYEEQPPVIDDVIFYVNGVETDFVEQGRELVIKVVAIDDVSLDLENTFINISWLGGSELVNATNTGEYVRIGGDYREMNYTASFVPEFTTTYYFNAFVYSEFGLETISEIYELDSLGKTNLDILQNQSSINLSGINKYTSEGFYVNYTLENLGFVNAYNSSLSFSSGGILTSETYPLGIIFPNSTFNQIALLNVSSLTPSGEYEIRAIIDWENPDGSSDSSYIPFIINVLENKSFDFAPSSLDYVVDSGDSSSETIVLENTGNSILEDLSFNCYTGDLCENFVLSYDEENSLNVSINDSESIDLFLEASEGLAAGDYSGRIEIQEKDISKTFAVDANVPRNIIWSVDKDYVNERRAAGQSGVLTLINITNEGNVNMSFDLDSSNWSIIQPNVSTIDLGILESKPFAINYSSPWEEENYTLILTVDAPGLNPLYKNIVVDLIVTKLELDVLSPSNETPLMNITEGDRLSAEVRAVYEEEVLSENLEWNLKAGNNFCEDINYVYSSSTDSWIISGNAPDLSDGDLYDLEVIAVHPIYGEVSAISEDSVHYLDVSAPSIRPIRNNIQINENIFLEANVTDNLEVDRVFADVYYPTGNEVRVSLSYSNGTYKYEGIVLETSGEYIVNYTAVDTTGNNASVSDWFEVFDKYVWDIKMEDHKKEPVSGVNISFLRSNTEEILFWNSTNDLGEAMFDVNRRTYDLYSIISSETIKIEDADFTNEVVAENFTLDFSLHELHVGDLEEVIPKHKYFKGVASKSVGFQNNSIEIVFDYTDHEYSNPTKLSVVRCSVWNYTDRNCMGTWSEVESSRNIDDKLVTGFSSGFDSVAYFLTEDRCGNGLCESSYGETEDNCIKDCRESEINVVVTPPSSGGGGGGGSTSLSSESLEDVKKAARDVLSVGGIKIDTTSIYKELFPGDTTSLRISLMNLEESSVQASLLGEGEIKDFLFFESSNPSFGPGEVKNLVLKIDIPKDTEEGLYEGSLVVEVGGEEGKLPITIRILQPEGKLMDVKIEPLTSSVPPGETLRLDTTLINLGRTSKIDVQFDLQLIDVVTGETVVRKEEAFAVETTVEEVKNITIPDYLEPGRYMIKATAYYSNVELDGDMQATSLAYIIVKSPFLERSLFGIKVLYYVLFFSFILVLVGIYFYYRYLEYKKKRFKSKVNPKKLPKPGKNAIFVGDIAETGTRTFLNLNDLKTHTLIAGSTGGGKTVAAQDIIEGVLDKGKSAIVFDPTAQWTGFLRKCTDKKMLKRYGYFDMKRNEAKAYDGRIRVIKDPYEMINIENYLDKPGEITIFDISGLTPKEIDIVVASTIQQVFKSKPEESEDLKTILVYDEVHRLLPKFGGSGEGFVQIERAAREFRKWGIGLFLISQVLSDFVGEVKANIGTEIQMGTRYEGDLERVKTKYGEDILRSVAREPVGTGMIFNAEYNDGRPYFIAYRPLKHSKKSLGKEELKEYGKYFDIIEDLEYQISELKKEGTDVMDLDIEMKLVRNKVKTGQFKIVEMYLESLNPKMEEKWKSLGKKPRHLEKKRISKEEVLKGVKKAKQERKKFKKEETKEELPAENVSEENFDLEEYLKNVKNWVKKAEEEGADTSKLKKRVKEFESKFGSINGTPKKEEEEEIKKEINEIVKIMNTISEDLNK